MLSWLLGIVAVGAVAAVALAIYARSVSDDPAVWHLDPAAAPRATSPNTALIGPREGADAPAPVWAAEPAALLAALDRVALAEARTARIAGAPEALHATYVQRSRLMGWPDYVSVRALPAEGGATLLVYSRSRFGESDLGVNRARLDRWLAAVDLPRAE